MLRRLSYRGPPARSRYISRLASAFVFGSQINMLARHRRPLEGRLDVDSVREYTRLNYVPAPATIFRDVHKVRPAEFIVIDEQGEVVDQRIYWSPSDSLETELPKVTGSTDETLSHLETALHGAIRSRMLSDVPIGAFLSGGIDSSLVSALMQANSSGPIRTFSIGSDQMEADEAKYAKQVARHLGSDHTELYISEDEVKKALPLIPQIFDEPLADASQIPTFLVSQLAVKDIKVVLSGDGGDELFAGYNRHRLAPQLWKRLRLVPMPLRPLLAGGWTVSAMTRRGYPGSQVVEFRAPKARHSSTSWRARCAPVRIMNSMSCFRRTGSPRPVFSRRRRGPQKCGGEDGLGRVRSCSRCCSVTSTGSCRMTCW